MIFYSFFHTAPIIFLSSRKKDRKQEKNLLKYNHRAHGRNNRGVITCRHRGGGHKRLYRKVDFYRKKLGSIGYVNSVNHDPNRNANIALVSYRDGEKIFIIAPKDLKIGMNVVAGFRVPVKLGNTLPLWNIPFGTSVHNVELNPGGGGKLSRSAGTSAYIIARENSFVTIRLPSGEVRLVSQSCWATVGQVGNEELRNKEIGKAGRIRWIGWRPVVRGSVINPVDHPHGGGEGCCPIGRSHPSTPWGKPSLGVKTRCKKKYSNVLIIRRKRLLLYYLFLYGSFGKKRPLCSASSFDKG